MRSVGVGLAFVATALMVARPAFAIEPGPQSESAQEALQQDKDVKAKKELAKKPVPTTGNVMLHIDSPDQQVSLEKRTGGATWEHACNSPCDATMSVSDEYRIVGDGLNESKPFMLDSTNGDKVTINVAPGKKSKYTTGLWIVGGGAALGIAGTIVIIAGSSSNSVPGANGIDTSTKNTNIITVGTILIVGGVVAAITGGAMAVDNAHTQVNGAVATPPEHKSDTNGLNVQVNAGRGPTWHEATGPAPRQFVTVPLLSGTF